MHEITKLKWFSSHLAVVFAQSIEARCWVENEDVVGAAPTGDAPTTSEWSTILLPTKVHSILEVWQYNISSHWLRPCSAIGRKWAYAPGFCFLFQVLVTPWSRPSTCCMSMGSNRIISLCWISSALRRVRTAFNSFAPGRCGYDSKWTIFKHIFVIDDSGIAFPFKLPSEECHRTSLMMNQC